MKIFCTESSHTHHPKRRNVRSTVVFIGFDASGRSKPLPYHRILSVGVGAHDDPNICHGRIVLQYFIVFNNLIRLHYVQPPSPAGEGYCNYLFQQ